MWARFDGELTVAPDGVARSVVLADFETAYGAQLIGCTIVRIRGVMLAQSVAATAAVDQIRAAMIVEPNPGAAAAIADGPFGGEFNDWMMFEPFLAGGTTSTQHAGTDAQGRVIDVKSARKLDELGQGLFMYVSTPAANGAAVTLTWDLSIGVKLP